jgi:hypothetical protein
MRPEDALSPRDRLTTGSLTIIYTHRLEHSWSVAEMEWDRVRRVGCRWNGNLDDSEDKGQPAKPWPRYVVHFTR